MLVYVGNALLMADVSPPERAAVYDGAVAAIFAHVSRYIEVEIDDTADPKAVATFDTQRWRKIVAACQPPFSDDYNHVVAADCDDMDEWEWLLQSISEDILWDDDWAMDYLFLDAEPQIGRREKARMDIAPEYFTTPAPDLRDEQVAAVLSELRLMTKSAG